MLQRHLQETFGREVLFLHGGVAASSSATAMVERFQNAADAPPIFILSLKAGGTGLNLTGGQPRLPLRPLVEPGRREPGHRPRLPHRPDAQRAGPQVPLRRHARGEDRRDDREEEGGRRAGRRHRRRLADRALDRRSCATCSPCARARWRSSDAEGRRSDWWRALVSGAARAARGAGRHQGAVEARPRSARAGGPGAGSTCWSASTSAAGSRAAAPTRASGQVLDIDDRRRVRDGVGAGIAPRTPTP